MDQFYAVDDTTTIIPVDKIALMEKENDLLKNQIKDFEKQLKKAEEKAQKFKKTVSTLYIVLILLLLAIAGFMFWLFFQH